MHITKNSTAVFWLLAVMLIYAPLFRASNIPMALMFLKLMSIAVLVLLLFGNEAIQALKKSHLVIIGLILAVPLLGLLPLPDSIWSGLPGRDTYMPVLEAVTGVENGFLKTISLAGPATEYALWTLLPPLIVYIATVNLPRKNLYTLVYIVLGIAVFQAALGLMQFGAGPSSPLYFGNKYATGASGTWLNQDHYAGFLEMVFPVAVALMAATVGMNKTKSVSPQTGETN